MITAVIAGNLGKDCEVKTVGGSTVTKFSVASTQKTKDSEKTTWISCDYWGKSGEAVSKFLTKGKQVAVSGSLSTREYEGKTYLEMRVSDLKLMGGDKSAGGAQHSTRSGSSSSGGFDGPSGGDDSDDVPF